MKALFAKNLLITGLIGLVGLASPARGQDKTEKLIDIKAVLIDVQRTPDIAAKNVKEKRWTPKDWIEVEVPFVASRTEGGQGFQGLRDA